MAERGFVATKPEDLGIDSERLEAVFSRAKRDVTQGILPSASVAVARHGRLAGFRTYGRAIQGGRLKPASEATLYNIFSATKAIVAVAVWTLFEDGLLHLDERVAEIIPEFGTNGKDQITVEQAMLHVGGFPIAPIGRGRWESREERLRAFSEWRLSWEPGTRFQYHATSMPWVLAEIIERRTGVEFRTFIRQRLLDPMGLEHLYVGLPVELNDRVAEVVYTREVAPPPDGWGEVSPEFIVDFNRPEVRAVGVPGAGGIGRAAELALFYQPLINGGVADNGTRVLKAETIAFATEVRTNDSHRDPYLDYPVNRALGVVVAGDPLHVNLRGFGRNTSALAFGHGGAGGQIGWGDPDTGISVGYCTNGFVDPIVSGRRMTSIGSLASLCVA